MYNVDMLQIMSPDIRSPMYHHKARTQTGVFVFKTNEKRQHSLTKSRVNSLFYSFWEIVINIKMKCNQHNKINNMESCKLIL